MFTHGATTRLTWAGQSAQIGRAYAHEIFSDGSCLGICVEAKPQCPAAILAQVAVADRLPPAHAEKLWVDRFRVRAGSAWPRLEAQRPKCPVGVQVDDLAGVLGHELYDRLGTPFLRVQLVAELGHDNRREIRQQAWGGRRSPLG